MTEPCVWKWAKAHEKPNLPEAFHERRTREFGGESEGPPFHKKINLEFAEMQLIPLSWGGGLTCTL